MMNNRFDKYLYKLRWPMIILALVWILYLVASIRVLPFDLVWRPDITLKVAAIPQDSSLKGVLIEGDVIIAVDGAKVKRTERIFSGNKDAFMLTLFRDGQSLNIPVSINERTLINSVGSADFSLVVFSLIVWLSALLLLLLVKPMNPNGLHIGFALMLLAVWILSYRGALSGIPHAWILGHSLGFLVGVRIVYMGFWVGSTPTRLTNKLFLYASIFAVCLGLVGLVEVISLYPESSLNELVGLSWVQLQITFAAAGLFLHLLVLVYKFLGASKGTHTYKQFGLLLLFIGFGTFPSILVLLVPESFFEQRSFILELAFALLLLIPAGYIFVANRTIYSIDKIFLNITLGSITIFTIILVYEVSIRAIDILFGEPANGVLFFVALFVLALLQPIRWILNRLEYMTQGVRFSQETAVENFATALTDSSDSAMIKATFVRVVEDLDIRKAVILMWNSDKTVTPLINNAVLADDIERINMMIKDGQKKLPPLNLANVNIFYEFDWAKAVIPIMIRGNSVGVLVTSNPADEPFVNSDILNFLSLVATVIVIGLEAINSFEASLQLSGKLLQVREVERKAIARRIHDEPLQKITAVTNMLDSYTTDNEDIKQAVAIVREAGQTLRQICRGLRPQVLGQGLELALRDAIHKFCQTAPHIQVETFIDKSHSPLREDTVTAIYYICLEAFNNIAKHAQASKVNVRLNHADDMIVISIADDGRGFIGANDLINKMLRDRHFGLVGMTEWAKSINGRLSFNSVDPSGLEVRLQIPFV